MNYPIRDMFCPEVLVNMLCIRLEILQ